MKNQRSKKFAKKETSTNLSRARLAIDRLLQTELPEEDERQFSAPDQLPKSKKKMRKEERKAKRMGLPYLPSDQNTVNGQPELSPPKTVQVKGHSKAFDNSSNLMENRRAKKKVKLSNKGKKAKRKKDLIAANREEEKIIKKLEKGLNFRKKRKTKEKILPGVFKADGLDYLLDIVDPKKLQIFKESGEEAEEIGDLNLEGDGQGDESDEDEQVLEGLDDEESDEESGLEDEDENFCREEDDDRSDDEAEGKEIGKGKSGNTEDLSAIKKRENVDLKKHKPFVDTDNVVHQASKELKTTQKRKRNDSEISDTDLESKNEGKEGVEGSALVSETSSSMYVPPHKRAQMLADAVSQEKKEELQKIKRQVKGLINRLSASNVQSVATQIEELYRTKSRNDMNETLFSVLQESLITPTLASERLVMEQVLLVAILHSNIGSEVGAHFVQSFVNSFDVEHRTSQTSPDPNKKCDNIISVLTHMYNFKVVHCCLIYDIIQRLVESFQEQDIEMLLLLLKNSGMMLRKDDPSALKEIILQVQAKAAASSHEFQTQSRIKFMLDTIYALRNNNARKIPNYDPDHLERLRKLLRTSIGSRGHNDSDSTLRVSLKDLLSTEQKGRWWIVGSAWSGRGPSDDQSRKSGSKELFTAFVMENTNSEKIMDLARKQRMNTDIRKNLFGVIVTAEDYEDGFQKVLKLGLKGGQEKEIIHVILDCCLQESSFNPYYAHLASKLCIFDRKLRMACQFAYWDKFSMMEQLTKTQNTNLALMLSHLLTTKALSLSVLKIIEFADINKSMVKFLKTLMVSVLDQSPDRVKTIFSSIANVRKLNHLKETLTLFLHHFVLKKLNEKEAEKWKSKVSIAEEAMKAST